ncbi:hypothetical protein Y032_0162g3413 [Ancylostoma ceylanicum]|uniref:Uncharacterized protein n=1 Tax=Ancylostoma ceylanicum TaxID=53326 RepID=A0A016SXV7_9BILA|nr:hypothetical protein Y032_0162g3413 [Ancylostoma ceylanicum]
MLPGLPWVISTMRAARQVSSNVVNSLGLSGRAIRVSSVCQNLIRVSFEDKNYKKKNSSTIFRVIFQLINHLTLASVF